MLKILYNCFFESVNTQKVLIHFKFVPLIWRWSARHDKWKNHLLITYDTFSSQSGRNKIDMSKIKNIPFWISGWNWNKRSSTEDYVPRPGFEEEGYFRHCHNIRGTPESQKCASFYIMISFHCQKVTTIQRYDGVWISFCLSLRQAQPIRRLCTNFLPAMQLRWKM